MTQISQRPRRSPREQAHDGKQARKRVPRESHADWQPPADRADPLGLLERQAVSRVPELVPVRYQRMLVSPFAYFRGAALPMAADLARTPASGLTAQLCGDAHLSNFGVFGTPERRLVFDVNDFDETLPGPWEWDVKRLAASLEIAGRDNGFGRAARREVVTAAAARYRQAMREFAAMGDLDVWYVSADVDQIRQVVRLSKAQRKAVKASEAKARTSDSTRALAKLTSVVDGEPRIISDPPLIVPIDELASEREIAPHVRGVVAGYRRSLATDRRVLLDGYRYAHAARKVVGVGSVGTRCWIVLLFGRDHADPLFLQVKEAQESVLSPFAGRAKEKNQGQRVVAGQRLMQAASDIFLGWNRTQAGFDGRPRDFYVRQLRDWKLSLRVETMTPGGMAEYAMLCGWTLARAHARSGERIAIAAYLGAADVFDMAIADFAAAYADQNERDYRRLSEAAGKGVITVADAPAA